MGWRRSLWRPCPLNSGEHSWVVAGLKRKGWNSFDNATKEALQAGHSWLHHTPNGSCAPSQQERLLDPPVTLSLAFGSHSSATWLRVPVPQSSTRHYFCLLSPSHSRKKTKGETKAHRKGRSHQSFWLLKESPSKMFLFLLPPD